jgi:hypothetical protein
MKRITIPLLLLGGMLSAVAWYWKSHPTLEDRYRHALLLTQSGEFALSNEEIRSVLEEWSDRPDAEWHWKLRLLEAENLFELGEQDSARSLLEERSRYCAAFPELNVLRLLLLVKLHVRSGRFDTASPLLEEAERLARERQ